MENAVMQIIMPHMLRRRRKEKWLKCLCFKLRLHNRFMAIIYLTKKKSECEWERERQKQADKVKLVQ